MPRRTPRPRPNRKDPSRADRGGGDAGSAPPVSASPSCGRAAHKEAVTPGAGSPDCLERNADDWAKAAQDAMLRGDWGRLTSVVSDAMRIARAKDQACLLVLAYVAAEGAYGQCRLPVVAQEAQGGARNMSACQAETQARQTAAASVLAHRMPIDDVVLPNGLAVQTERWPRPSRWRRSATSRARCMRSTCGCRTTFGQRRHRRWATSSCWRTVETRSSTMMVTRREWVQRWVHPMRRQQIGKNLEGLRLA